MDLGSFRPSADSVAGFLTFSTLDVQTKGIALPLHGLIKVAMFHSSTFWIVPRHTDFRSAQQTIGRPLLNNGLL